MTFNTPPKISNEEILWDIMEKHDIINPYTTPTEKRNKVKKAMLEYGEYVKKNTIKICIKSIEQAFEGCHELDIISDTPQEIIEDLKKEL